MSDSTHTIGRATRDEYVADELGGFSPAVSQLHRR